MDVHVVLALQQSRRINRGVGVIPTQFGFQMVYLVRIHTVQDRLDILLGNVLDDLDDLSLAVDKEETLLDVLNLVDGDGMNQGSVEDLGNGGGKSVH